MSNENEFVASVNRLETLIDSNQTDLKREVGSLIDRRFSSLKEEVNKLKCAQSALNQINNLMALWDDRHELNDLPNRIRTILEGVTANNHDLDSSEVGGNATVEPANNLGGNELGSEEHVNSLDTNVPSTSTVNDHNRNSSTSDNEQVNGHSPNHEQSEPLSTSSSTIATNIKTEDASNSQQSVQMCKRVKMEQDAQYITDSDSDSDCDCDECIYGIVKREVKEELVETCQLDRNNGQSVILGIRVKKEEETSDDENVIGHRVELQMALEGGEDPNDNRQESLLEQSNGTNQSSVNDQSIDQQEGQDYHEPSQSISTTTNPTLTQSGDLFSPSTSTGRRSNRTALNQQATVSTGRNATKRKQPTSNQTAKRSKITIEDDEDIANEDQEEAKVKVLHLNCTQSNCNVKFDSMVHLHDHLRTVHRLAPLQCFATNCNARFDNRILIREHITLHHPQDTRFLCAVCRQEFNSQHNAYNHWYQSHLTGQFECNFVSDCVQVSDTRSKMRTHQQTKHEYQSKHFQCIHPGCSASFGYKAHLKRHQLIHLDRKPFHCNFPHCSHRTHRRAHLVTHIRTQHFGLPRSMKAQKAKNIVDLRDPNEYVRVVVDE